MMLPDMLHLSGYTHPLFFRKFLCNVFCIVRETSLHVCNKIDFLFDILDEENHAVPFHPLPLCKGTTYVKLTRSYKVKGVPVETWMYSGSIVSPGQYFIQIHYDGNTRLRANMTVAYYDVKRNCYHSIRDEFVLANFNTERPVTHLRVLSRMVDSQLSPHHHFTMTEHGLLPDVSRNNDDDNNVPKSHYELFDSMSHNNNKIDFFYDRICQFPSHWNI
jgi:hypothetical protein